MLALRTTILLALAQVVVPSSIAVQMLPSAVRWSVPISSSPVAPPVIDKDQVFVVLQSGAVEAHKVADGTIAWKIELRSDFPVAVDDDRVYVAALDNVVRGLDRKSGNLRWQRALDRRLVAGVQIAGHVVFVDVSGAELVMLFDATGARSGSIALPRETTGNLAIDVRETDTNVQVFP